MATNNRIWVFKGENKKFLDEKFESPDGEEVEIYVWQNFDQSLGFSESERGIQFLLNLLNSTYTVFFPKIESVESEADILKNIYGLKGVSFWDNKKLSKEQYEEYCLFKQQEKKNRLLKKYGKKLIEIHKPKILEWFVNNQYSEQFSSFIKTNKIEYVIWAYSDFGTYFYHIPSTGFVLNKVKNLCNENGYDFCQVDDMKKIPYH